MELNEDLAEMSRSKLGEFINDAKVIVVSGWSGTGKSTFVKEQLKGTIVDPFDKVTRLEDKVPFESKPDWQVSQVWAIDGLENWEEASLQKSIIDVQAELIGSRKLVLITFNIDEVVRAGIVFNSTPCFVQFNGLGKATLEYEGKTVSLSFPKQSEVIA